MRKFVPYSLPALLVGCIGIASVNADPPGDAVQPSPAATETGIKAGRVFLDPETGEVGPPPPGTPSVTALQPPGLSPETRQKLDRSSQGLQAQTLPDGTRLLNLQGRFQNFSVVTLDQHGEAHLSCNHSAGEVERALEQGADPVAERPASTP
jgi:hypothetical protein